MSDLSLARITMVHALRHDTHLVIYIQGLTSGYGGKLIVEQRPERLPSPLFRVHAKHGPSGINPKASPKDVLTVAAYSFDDEGRPDSILVESADQRQEIKVVNVLSGTTSVTSNDQGEAMKDDNEVGNCDWTAIHDFMPPGPARLRVNATCVMPTPGYKLSLKKAVPQGINPHILILELETQLPSGIVPQVLTPTPVAYEETTDFDYTQVTIRSSDVTEGATIDVQIVH